MIRAYKFPKPISLNDGRAISTLGEAHELILSLAEGHQRDPHWQYAGELLLKASVRGEKYSVVLAQAQLKKVLKAEGLM